MSSILNRVRNAYSRVRRGVDVICFPENVYFYHKNIHEYHTLSFSQEGEDLILASLFDGKSHGFYVDVGAHHPQRFSNTYYFYLRGWEGINIDAMPGAMDRFKCTRPRDISLELAVSDAAPTLTYYAFEEPALNTFCKRLADRYRDVHREKLLFKRDIPTCTLAEILDRYLPVNRSIDFLSVNVEGLDLQVLRSNDWQKHAPTMVLVEDHTIRGRSLAEINGFPIASFLRAHGYEIFSRTLNTLIFGRSKEFFHESVGTFGARIPA